jgi:hypothetical protein
MTLVPPQFLFRLAFQCPHVPGIPVADDEELFDLPPECRVPAQALLTPQPSFADVRLGWNDLGLAVQVEVRGKNLPSIGDASRPHGSDGLRLWLDTRDTRNIHRASRYCHQFHFLPCGGGPDGYQPVAMQTKIHRAQQDAPLCSPSQLPFHVSRRRGGYRLTAFLPAGVLQGFDPENHPRLGFYFVVKDAELGDQSLGLGPEFPFWEDPSLWSTLELVGGAKASSSRKPRGGKRA